MCEKREQGVCSPPLLNRLHTRKQPIFWMWPAYGRSFQAVPLIATLFPKNIFSISYLTKYTKQVLDGRGERI